MYDGVECEKSFYLFLKKFCLRKILYKVTTHWGFEHVILGLIVFSSIKLTLDTYITSDTPDWLVITSEWIGNVLTILFALESLVKSISLGFA